MMQARQKHGALLLMLLSAVSFQAFAQVATAPATMPGAAMPQMGGQAQATGMPQMLPVGMPQPQVMPPAGTAPAAQTKSENRDFFVTNDQLFALGVKSKPDQGVASPQEERSLLMQALQNMQDPPEDPDFSPSYGDMETSILFSDADTQIIRKALERVERIMASGGTVGVTVTERPQAQATAEPQQAAPIAMELPFYAYHVSSIVYRSPSDWMIWLNGKRVTPKINKGDVRVVGVGRDHVRLRWKPDHWEERLQVWNDKQPLSREIRKLQVPGSTYVDEQTQAIYATLRPNQTWVTATPVVVEGQHLEFEVTLKAANNIEAQNGRLQVRYSGGEAQARIEELARQSAEQIKKNSQRTVEEQQRESVAAARAAAQSNQANTATPAAVAPATIPMAAPVVPSLTQQNVTGGGMPATMPGQPTSLNDILSAISSTPPPAAIPSNTPPMAAPAGVINNR